MSALYIVGGVLIAIAIVGAVLYWSRRPPRESAAAAAAPPARDARPEIVPPEEIAFPTPPPNLVAPVVPLPGLLLRFVDSGGTGETSTAPRVASGTLQERSTGTPYVYRR